MIETEEDFVKVIEDVKTQAAARGIETYDIVREKINTFIIDNNLSEQAIDDFELIVGLSMWEASVAVTK